MKKMNYVIIGLAMIILIGVVALVLAGGPQAIMGSIMGARAEPDLDTSEERLSDGEAFRAAYTSSINPVPVNQIHTWTIHLETPDEQPIEQAEITVDGGMPQHGHGLPTRPQVTQNLGGGDYLVEGLKFNMPGWWEVTLHITADGKSDSVTFNLILK